MLSTAGNKKVLALTLGNWSQVTSPADLGLNIKTIAVLLKKTSSSNNKAQHYVTETAVNLPLGKIV
jgi:hypothetical protein